MARSYHPRDYDWTPLSQNPARTCNDTVSTSPLGGNDRRLFDRSRRQTVAMPQCWTIRGKCTVAALCPGWSIPSQCQGAKSLVDDLGYNRGVVLSRAATILRSIETKPYDWLICLLLDRQVANKNPKEKQKSCELGYKWFLTAKTCPLLDGGVLRWTKLDGILDIIDKKKNKGGGIVIELCVIFSYWDSFIYTVTPATGRVYKDGGAWKETKTKVLPYSLHTQPGRAWSRFEKEILRAGFRNELVPFLWASIENRCF